MEENSTPASALTDSHCFFLVRAGPLPRYRVLSLYRLALAGPSQPGKDRLAALLHQVPSRFLSGRRPRCRYCGLSDDLSLLRGFPPLRFPFMAGPSQTNERVRKFRLPEGLFIQAGCPGFSEDDRLDLRASSCGWGSKVSTPEIFFG